MIREINGQPTCTKCGYQWSAMLGDDEWPGEQQALRLHNCDCETNIQISECMEGKWLDKALADLSEADTAAEDEGFAPSSKLSQENAKAILRELQKSIELSPSVYPTSDQEIAIQFVASEASVLILCDQFGGGACFSFVERKNRWARFDDAMDLPSGFAIAEILRLTAIKKQGGS